MTRDEIIRMAEQASLPDIMPFLSEDELQCVLYFAAIVSEAASAAEREACIALHDHEDVLAPVGNSAWGEAHQEGWVNGTSAYRDAIRARGEKGQS